MRTPRGLRNNNPGNIRRSAGVNYCGEREGADKEFRTFVAAHWGYRAIFVLLHTYRLRYSVNTIAEAIGRWAPPSENQTEAYIATVEKLSGRERGEAYDTLSAEDMLPIVAAIAWVENGVVAATDELRRGWQLFAQDYCLSREE